MDRTNDQHTPFTINCSHHACTVGLPKVSFHGGWSAGRKAECGLKHVLPSALDLDDHGRDHVPPTKSRKEMARSWTRPGPTEGQDGRTIAVFLFHFDCGLHECADME